ncbi:MAG: 1-acyl-sn-glycerol-3-phosphate acyltransferase [Anaerolineales bacterium]|nr:1-acyl-sn-glycerol-3-phosphate acyltransferase [Anaerolineales bacterium]
MQRLIRWVAKLVVFLLADVKTYGKEHMRREGACIVVSNHLGRLDAVLALTLADRDDLILLIAEKYRAYALWRFVSRHLDAIWLNRFDADIHAMREVVRRLRQGQFLAIAPEGTRSKSEALAPGKPGAAFLAARTGVPIVPIAITGTEDRLVKANLRRLRRSKVVVRAGRPFTLPPIDRHNRTAHLEAQTDEIMCRIAALLPPPYRGAYADHPRLHALLPDDAPPHPRAAAAT